MIGLDTVLKIKRYLDNFPVKQKEADDFFNELGNENFEEISSLNVSYTNKNGEEKKSHIDIGKEEVELLQIIRKALK